MTYELAKQLKDAGFPQGMVSVTPQPSFYEDEAHTIFIRNPTLSELITACGDKFKALERIKPGYLWRAWAFGDKHPFAHDIPEKVLHDSPEEAVAHLWLALNKKQ